MALSFEDFNEIKGATREIKKVDSGTANLNGIQINVRVVTLEDGKQGMVNLERWDDFKKACVKGDNGMELGEGWKIAQPRKGLTVGFLYDSAALTEGNQGNSLTIG